MPAFYSKTATEFLTDNSSHIIGELTANSGRAGFFQQQHIQTLAWDKQIKILKESLLTLTQHHDLKEWGVLFEYPIPRRAKRIDTVILLKGLILVIEFKINSKEYHTSDKTQAEDYCLDVRDFHKQSHRKNIIPILVASEAPTLQAWVGTIEQNVHQVLLANKDSLSAVIDACVKRFSNNEVIDLNTWNTSEYVPTPTIIEAAKHLYAGKNVKEISRCQAGSDNLEKTTEVVIEAINKAKRDKLKTICFITGVPGAGKTLAGLNIVHNHQLHSEGDLGVFLSGNGPLVKVLTFEG